MSGILDCTFEDEVVGDFASSLNETHEAPRFKKIGTFLEDIFCPFHEDSANRTRIERTLAIFCNLSYFSTSQNIGT